MSLTKEQVAAVKGRGFLRNRGTDAFSGRVVSVAGQFSARELRAVADCAEQFGDGRVVFTSRLSAEIVGIPYEKIDAAEQFLALHGLEFGGTGAKVRPITACKGSTCVFGNIDTHALARILHERFYLGMSGVKLPHKFKIGVGGCPNSCMKPSLNDVGVEGCRSFTPDTEKCRGCRICAVEQGCPSRAAHRGDGGINIDPDRCLKCGVCIGKCPFGAIPKEAESACRIFVGGTWGKTRREGIPLSRTFTPEQVPEVVEAVILWYKDNGAEKERLASTIDRLGIEALERSIAERVGK